MVDYYEYIILYIFTFLVLSLCFVTGGTPKVLNTHNYNHSEDDKVF